MTNNVNETTIGATPAVSDGLAPPSAAPLFINGDYATVYGIPTGGGSDYDPAKGYCAYDPGGGAERTLEFDLATPGTTTDLWTSTTPDFIAAGTWADGVWYGTVYGTGQLWEFDPDTGVGTSIGGGGTGLNGLAWDPSTETLFGCSGSSLYTVDPATGTQTMIGTMGASDLFIAIGCDDDGVIYGLDIVTDILYTIDPVTAAKTAVGPTGYAHNYAQDMEYDHDNDVLYMSAYTTAGQLMSINTATGAGTIIGNFPNGMEVCGFAIPYSGVALEDDVGVTSIVAPASGQATGPITPTVTVKNFGTNNQTAVPVHMDITRYGTPISYYSDGFETYSAGYYDMPAGWTVQTTNPTGTWYMYSSSSTYSASTYPRVQESGSDGNAQDESLISPVIDCSDLTNVSLIFYLFYFYAYSPDYATATIYISNDAGTTWNELVNYTATTTGTKTFDVTSYAAGQDDVQIKIRFESAADTTLSSYMYFDNMWIGDPTPGDWGLYGDVPPLGWTIERFDTTSWDYNHWYRYSSSSYDMYRYAARIAYASPYPEINDNLTSPSINCSDMTKVILTFNCYHYAYTSYMNEGSVQVSIDDGVTWQDVDVYDITPPGSYGYCIQYEYYNGYDITAIAAGESNVKIRFHFTRPAGATSGYWYLDNVRVHDGSGTFKFIETFDTGKAAYFTVFKNYVHDNWGDWDWIMYDQPYYYNVWNNVETGTDPVCTPFEGLRMAQYRGNIYQGHKALLFKIDPINVAAANTLKMSFWMYQDTQAGAGNIKVLASHDGLIWEEMGTVNRNGPLGWNQFIINLDGFEDDTAMRIAFLAESDYSAYIHIDDVNIFDPGLVLEESLTEYVDILAGEILTVEFDDWTPLPWQTQEDVIVIYEVEAYTDLTGDEKPDNDGKFKTINLYFPFFYDVTMESITSPAGDGDAKPLPVKAVIKNIGQYPVRNFFATAEIGSSIARSVQEDFSGTTVPNMPAGWHTNNAKWTTVNTASAGGTAPEARFYWSPSETGQFRMYCDPFNTVGQTDITLSFKHYVNHYATPYTLRVETSTDGGTTWNSAWSVSPTASIGPETVTVPLNASHGVGAPSFQISFTFDGYSFNINYWYVDNIVCGTLPPIVDAEYDESKAIDTWLQPGESRELEYPLWTPENLISPQDSGVIKYTVLCDSGLGNDTNPANDVLSKDVRLTYWHDVAVNKITQPSIGRDLTWLGFDGPNADAIGLTAGGTWIAAIRLTPTELGTYDGYKVTNVKMFHGWEGGTSQPSHTGRVIIYDAGTSSEPGAILHEEPVTVPAGNAWFEVELASAVTVDGSKDMWVAFELTQGAGEYPFGCDAGPNVAGKGDWAYLSGWLTLSIYGFDINWNIEAGLQTGGPGPGAADIYVKPGTQPIQAEMKDLGVFEYEDLTANGIIWDYTSDPNGTIAYNEDVNNIDLTPLGGTQTVDFPSFNFADEGLYKLIIELPLGVDDIPTNNAKDITVGVDDTAPISTAALTPADPNGANDWYITDVTVTLSASDPEVNGVASGVDIIKYRIDGGSWQTYTAPFDVSASGEHVVEYYAIDNVGNEEALGNEITFKIDQAPPTVLLNKETLFPNKMKFTVECDDADSGVDYVEFILDTTVVFTDTEAPFEYVLDPCPTVPLTMTATVYDVAGNYASESTNSVNSMGQPTGINSNILQK